MTGKMLITRRLAMASVAGAMMLSGLGMSASAQERGNRIGYSTYTASNPFFAGIILGINNAAEKHGFEVSTTNSNMDANRQQNDIQNLMSRGIDFLLVTPANTQAIAPAIRKAKQDRIPVISLADNVSEPINATVQADAVDEGVKAAEAIVAFLEKKYGAPKGKVVNITGISSLAQAQGRIVGFDRVLEKYPDIQLVAQQDGGFDTSKSATVMANVLQGNAEIDAVFAANDASAAGVISAIRSAGRFKPIGDADRIYVIGTDASPPGIAAIRAGTQDATVGFNPITLAETAVGIAVDIKAGKTVENLDIKVPLLVITAENIDSEEAKAFLWADVIGAK